MAWGHNTGKADEGLYGGGRNDFYMNEEMASRSIPELSFDQKVDIFNDFLLLFKFLNNLKLCCKSVSCYKLNISF